MSALETKILKAFKADKKGAKVPPGLEGIAQRVQEEFNQRHGQARAGSSGSIGSSGPQRASRGGKQDELALMEARLRGAKQMNQERRLLKQQLVEQTELLQKLRTVLQE